jgi:hypothetical protein
MALLAASHVAAAAAQASDQMEAAQYPATVNLTQTGENALSNGVRSVACGTANLTGELSAPSSTITITPAYSECTGNGNTTATVNTEGCTYTLHPEEVTSSTGTAEVTLSCSGAGMIIDIWATGKAHNETKLCRLIVPSQGPTPIGEYHNRVDAEGNEYVELTLASSSLVVNRTEGTALNCGAATKTNATFAGTADATASSEEEPIDLWIGSHNLNLIKATNYPATVNLTQTGENALSNGVRSVACASASLTGLLSAPSSTITITPAYSECTGSAHVTATINTVGCTYTFHFEGEAGASTGNLRLSITCSGAGIIIDTWAPGKAHNETKLCRFVLPSQGPTPFGEYHNREDEAGNGYLELTLSSSTLIMTRTEGTALNCGAATKTNATYLGTADATATNEEEPIDLWID